MADVSLAHLYRTDAIARFRSIRDLADRALAQAAPADLHRQPDEESNSVAIIMKHLSGNMISRWTDFLTSDGEKPSRNRDAEFLDDLDTDALFRLWNEGWQVLFDALGQLRDEDMTATVYIRGEAHSVVEAVNRQISHYAYHVGQIVYLCRMYRSDGWRSLSIPRGQSQTFNDTMFAGTGPRPQ